MQLEAVALRPAGRERSSAALNVSRDTFWFHAGGGVEIGVVVNSDFRIFMLHRFWFCLSVANVADHNVTAKAASYSSKAG